MTPGTKEANQYLSLFNGYAVNIKVFLWRGKFDALLWRREMQLTGRVVETPMGSTIDSLRGGGYWVCDRDRNCREVTGLWEAEEYLRERERGQAGGSVFRSA